MKKIVSIVFLAVLAAMVVLNGCGGLEADYTDDELAVEEIAEPESEEPVVEEPIEEPEAVEPDDTTKCADLDHDGYCGGPKDCNDVPGDANNDELVDGYFIHKGAVELCDEVDNDCDGKTDEGLPMYKVYIDNDGDGHGAGEELSVCSDEGYVHNSDDCDDSDADIHPGAADEPGDGVDSDCDDETAPVVTGEVEQFDLEVKISYRDNVHRVFSYQLYTDESFVGQWWDEEVPFSNKLVFEGNFEDASSFLGLRFNVAEGEPATSWLCEGNGRSAALDQSASIAITFLGVKYTAEDLTTWSAPDGAGCSGLLKF